jgi:hypothetical protein
MRVVEVAAERMASMMLLEKRIFMVWICLKDLIS